VVDNVIQYFSETVLADIHDILWHIPDVRQNSISPDGIFRGRRGNAFQLEYNIDKISQFISTGVGFSRRDQQSVIDEAAQISVDRGSGQAELLGGLARGGVRIILDRS
jgi:hypothetical protein